MMMPANFSAVNAEVVYGGAVADYLPNAWTAANVKTQSTNVLTILSNSFTKPLINATMGTMFSGTWGDDDSAYKKVLFGDDGTVSALYKNGTDDMTFGNKVMRTLGMVSVAYTLGTTDAKVGFNDNVMGAFGETY